MRHILTLFDFTPDEVNGLLETAVELKSRFKSGLRDSIYAGRVLGLLFDKPSLRTRVSFEAAMAHLGGSSIYLGSDVGLGKRESVEDFSRVFTNYVDVVVYRGSEHNVLERFAAAANCPVINGLTNSSHPCQAFGDLLTMRELHDDLTKQKLVFVGDGNNVARSLAVACALVGAEFVLATAAEYQLPRDFVDRVKQVFPDAKVEQTTDAKAAVEGASFVYTDVWTSMGQEAEDDTRKAVFAPFQVDAALMKAAGPQAHFMHCLPARRGQEVTNEVIDGPQSVVTQQAENRMHAQKAMLAWLFERRLHHRSAT